jgi:hypothetical protein
MDLITNRISLNVRRGFFKYCFIEKYGHHVLGVHMNTHENDE